MGMWTCGPTRGVLNLLVIMGFLTGCLPESRREAPSPKTAYIPPLPISAEAVETRKTRLSKLLERREASDQEKQVAKQLLQTYEGIKESLERPVVEQERQRIIRLLFDSLGNLDDAYFSPERSDETAYPKVLRIYEDRKAKILKDYRAGDHEGVINGCIAMERNFGKEALTPEMGLLFSVSLARQGRLNDAIRVGEKTLKQMEGRPDQVDLRANVIEWQLATGQERSARDSLEKLIQIANQREILLKQAKLRISPGEEVTSRQEGILASTPSEGAPVVMEIPSLEKLLSDVDELIRQREFTKAKFLLLQQKIRFQEGPETKAIDDAMRKVETAEGEETPAVTRQEESGVPKGEHEGSKIVKRLVEEENFEEAITKLEELQQEGNLDPETAQLREVAIEKLINRERNRAAKLYLMARNTADRAKKEELLLASHAILKNLLDKYPLSPLSKKVNDNITKIREEMESLKKNPG
ncbi:MAG: hypothetical protein JXL84_11520 [Deltaproteobacteria bacterium]|nr:hypothetical protein [Deltaproteobacteria bacterium]